MEIRESDVRNDIGKHFPALYALAVEAVSTYRNKYSKALHREHSKRSRASCVHDHFVAGAARFAEDTDGVRLVESMHLWVLYFDAGYSIRFKKLDDDKLPSTGQLTQQVIKYRNQQPLDGIPDSKHLDLGYQLNEAGELHKVYLVCPSGIKANQWDQELEDDGAASVVVNLFDTMPSDDHGGRIVPKKPKDDKTESGDGDIGA